MITNLNIGLKKHSWLEIFRHGNKLKYNIIFIGKCI